MQKYDLLIVGGGMVGLTLALAIRKTTNLTVAIADNTPLSELGIEAELRVSAINFASQQLFRNLGVWQAMVDQRVAAYQHMNVWDKSGYGGLSFDLAELNLGQQYQQLGHIIENNAIRQALWNKVAQDEGIRLYTQEPLTNVAIGDNEVFATFSQQMPISAKLVVGADGAHSWLRNQLAMKIAFRDYDHHALVATVDVKQGHQNTAWQVFLPNGPLAFLPLFNDHQCSIVWSTSPEDATRLQSLSKAQVAKELTAASDGKLGNITLASGLQGFPLTMRLAHSFTQERVVLVGDAAHTIHPLAGQGVNLGLLDAASLAQVISQAINQDKMWHSTPVLKQYNRWRRAEAAEMVVAMESIKQAFSPQNQIVKLIRGLGMSAINSMPLAKQALAKQALGIKSELPELSRRH